MMSVDSYLTPVSGNGRCLSMQDAAKVAYDDQKQLANLVYDTPWDAT
jgi:hypothetical protein